MIHLLLLALLVFIQTFGLGVSNISKAVEWINNNILCLGSYPTELKASA